MEKNTKSLSWKIIPISTIEGVRFGQVESQEGMTGVSVALLAKNTAGLDICWRRAGKPRSSFIIAINR